MLGRQIPGLEIPQEKKFGIKWNRKAALYYYMTQNSLSGEKKKRNNLLKDIIFLAKPRHIKNKKIKSPA